MFWDRKNTWHVVRVEKFYKYTNSHMYMKFPWTRIHYIRRPKIKHKIVTIKGHWTYEQLFGDS